MKKLAKPKKQKAEPVIEPPKVKATHGRNPIPVDEELLEQLAKLHLSDLVISQILKISEATLNRRFAEKIEYWKSGSKSKMANVLFDEALNKREPWALKALAQRHLGYADKTEIDVNKHKAMTDEELDAAIAEKQAKLGVK